MFIALLFVPLMRRMKKRGSPHWLNVATAILILFGIGAIVIFVLNLSSKEILSTKDDFLIAAEEKISHGSSIVQQYFGFGSSSEQINVKQELAKHYAQPTMKFLAASVPQLLMTLFFVVLWLAESINFENLLNNTILKLRHSSIKTFRRIEKDIVKFLQVKFLISLGTGVCTGILCYAFDVSFPIFWGVFAFTINFVQMIGSIITVVLCSLFAFIEMEPSSTLFLFILSITGVQVMFGSILEPIYMGRSFSINIIVVLVMLLFWGFIWGVPGMIMSIPITVFLKILFEQFPKTKRIARIMQ
jgi:predicted PurR-regulated permease PerM